MNMTEVSGPNRACYYLNPTTKKLELGTYDESAVMEKLQKRAEELKKNPVGQNTLTNEEIQELAKKFDPQNMTQKEYDSFIHYLEEKGVLSQLESSDIGMSVRYIIPGLSESVHIWTSSSHIGTGINTLDDVNGNTLDDVNGNALLFAQAMTQWEVPGSSVQIKQGAYAKVLRILDQMNTARASTGSIRPSSPLIGDLSSFPLAMDHIKNQYIQVV